MTVPCGWRRLDGVVLAHFDAALPMQAAQARRKSAYCGGGHAEFASQGFRLEGFVTASGNGCQYLLFKMGHCILRRGDNLRVADNSAHPSPLSYQAQPSLGQ